MGRRSPSEVFINGMNTVGAVWGIYVSSGTNISSFEESQMAACMSDRVRPWSALYQIQSLVARGRVDPTDVLRGGGGSMG